MDEGITNCSFDRISARSNPSVLVDKTNSAGDGLKTAHTNLDTRYAFFTLDSPQDDPIIVTDESKEEEADKEDTHDTSHDVPKETSFPPPLSLKASCFTSSSFLVQKQLKTLDSLPSLLIKVTKTMNRFSTMVENALEAITKDVPLASQATNSPAEGERNTKDAKTNLKDELVDLLGTNVVTYYYNKKLLFDKYCDKILKRKKNPKITNYKVLTKKGPITLKIYREDASKEVISNLKVNDLHFPEWREVIQACLDKSEKGWKTIYDLVKKKLDQKVYEEGKRLLYVKRNRSTTTFPKKEGLKRSP
uniref:Uncharacterized protein n=1 Tax=Tanacetum cinerariifolium TaxID=118510 RepID=A0A699JT67_TANCI|nr:hypothetical protein [Tanacetum cinerariifolium]